MSATGLRLDHPYSPRFMNGRPPPDSPAPIGNAKGTTGLVGVGSKGGAGLPGRVIIGAKGYSTKDVKED